MNKATSTEVPDLFVYANDLYTRFAHSERTRGWVGWVARSAWKRHWAQVAHTQSFHATPSSLNALEAQGVHRNFHDLTATLRVVFVYVACAGSHAPSSQVGVGCSLYRARAYLES